MTIATFGVTVDSVRKHHFPTQNAWSTSSSPSLATVTEMLDVEAGRLAGALLKESIPTSAIVAGTPEYASCQGQLRMMVARRALDAMTGADPAIAKRWDTAIDGWFKSLDADGPTFLGNDDLGTLSLSDADGPTEHLTEYGLAVDSDTLPPSDALNPFRVDDLL